MLNKYEIQFRSIYYVILDKGWRIARADQEKSQEPPNHRTSALVGVGVCLSVSLGCLHSIVEFLDKERDIFNICFSVNVGYLIRTLWHVVLLFWMLTSSSYKSLKFAESRHQHGTSLLSVVVTGGETDKMRWIDPDGWRAIDLNIHILGYYI